MSLKLAGDYFVYLLVRVFISLIQALRIETCQQIAHALARILYDKLRVRRKIIDDNLATALPHASLVERQEVARGMWEHLLLMICEIAHAPRKIHDTTWRDHIHMTLEDKRVMVQELIAPRPKVFVTAHFGNFEIAGYSTGVLGFSAHTVARTLDNRFLDRYVNEFREARGQYILPKVGSAPQADGVMEANGMLVLLGDQHAGDKGCWVEFFGRPASCHKALALFTLLSRAPMVVTYCRRESPMHFRLGVAGVADPAIGGPHLADVKTLTQWYNNRLEEEIRRAPSQYWWVHNRWRDGRKRAKKPLAAAA